jgi:predicted RNA-binding Zn ribbon-like protein
MSEPSPKEPAPGDLALVQEFINSKEMHEHPHEGSRASESVDALATPELAAEWLRSQGSDVETLSAKEVQRLVDTREALRDLLEDHTGQNVDPEVAVRLERLLGTVHVRPEFTVAGARLCAARPGVEGFLGRLAAAIVNATLDGTWYRLKICRRHDCRWAFYDHSKNACGTWCSMRSCGSREKARAYRERRKATQPIA